jgi:hypothetical protein
LVTRVLEEIEEKKEMICNVRETLPYLELEVQKRKLCYLKSMNIVALNRNVRTHMHPGRNPGTSRSSAASFISSFFHC